jgi:CRISPR/Cas system-associated exonuclease Cas4 (RecB family)
MITKTNYIQFLKCPKTLWLNKNRKDLKPKLDSSQAFRIEQGNIVDELARKLFEGVELIGTIKREEAKHKTDQLMRNKQTLYQACAIHDDLLVRADIINYNKEAEGWDLYEVKSSTELKKEYLDDVTFQKYVFEQSGHKIANCFVVYLNKEYIRNGEIDIKQLFTIDNVNEQVNERMQTIENQVNAAREVLEKTSDLDVPCGCTLSSSEYPDFCFPNLPKFSVHKLLSRSPKKRKELLDLEIVDVNDIPDDFVLNDRQNLYKLAHQEDKTIIDKQNIIQSLESLIYPLYFLDYETISVAIPQFDGYKPYQQMVFQYSVHVTQEDGSLDHFEYVAESSNEDPAKNLLIELSKVFDKQGTIIVWNESFEVSRNKEMAELYPEHNSFIMTMLNHRVFDLMKVFSEQLYVDPRFYGSYSIKKVLPVLVPELKYDNLEIRDGGSASTSWYRYHFENDKTLENLSSDLKEYCKLDTLAMVEIYKVLFNL